jgi:RNA-directed DNA polymerase
MIAKSTAIKVWGGKSGGRAVKAVGLTSGGLRLRPGNGTEVVARRLIAAQKSAEGIVGGSVRRRPERWTGR